MKNKEIKVAMIARPDLFLVKGGDTIQVKETAAALQKTGVNVDVIVDKEIDYSKYDILHFFNIIDPEDILGHLYASKLPYVVSTIYVDYSEYDRNYRTDLIGKLSKFLSRDTIEYLKTLAKVILKKNKVSTIYFFFKGHRSSIRYILKRAECLLPNSENEYKRLVQDYEVAQKHIVVPNAINVDLFNKGSNSERSIVLCVGRIEGNKNQLNVIRALKETSFQIVFIGATSPNQSVYADRCRKEAGSNVTFIDYISQEELVDYYCRAKVHVLASWFETTGLSSLEAAAMGCNIVVGNRGDVKDYFGDMAYYCEPGDLESIKNAVNLAWNSEVKAGLRECIFSNFTWDIAAEKTYIAYRQILNL